MIVQLTTRGLSPQEFRQAMKPKAGSEGVGYLNLPENNSRQNHGFLPGGLWMPNRARHGMTAQLNGNMNMGGCLTGIACGNETKNYVNGPLLGSMNPFAFPRLPLLQLHTGMALIMIPLIRPRPFRARSITYWKGVRMHLTGSKDRPPSVL